MHAEPSVNLCTRCAFSRSVGKARPGFLQDVNLNPKLAV